MIRRQGNFRHLSRGFTLAELLVAMAISLLGALAIMQVYVGSEAGKRATGSQSEAQGGGLVAIYSLEREIQQAGFGFTNMSVLGCRLHADLGNSFDEVYLQPVNIVPAAADASSSSNQWKIPPGDANSDMIVVAISEASAMVEGALTTVAANAGATSFRISSVLGLTVGDYLLLAENGKDCTMTRIQTVFANGDVTVSYPLATDYSLSAKVMHLGRYPQLAAYAVRKGMLTRCDFFFKDCADAGKINDTSVWVPVANDVVALVAQYGFDSSSPPDGSVDVICKSRVSPGENCPGSDNGTPAPGTDTDLAKRACDWSRIPMIQLALVTRSGQAEREEISPATLKLWPNVTASSPTTTGPEWTVPDRHYRYRVTRSAVALRNLIWMGAQSSC